MSALVCLGCEVWQVPQNGPVHFCFCQTVNVFSSSCQCCNQQVIHFFLHAQPIQVSSLVVQSKDLCTDMPPSILPLSNSSIFHSSMCESHVPGYCIDIFYLCFFVVLPRNCEMVISCKIIGRKRKNIRLESGTKTNNENIFSSFRLPEARWRPRI